MTLLAQSLSVILLLTTSLFSPFASAQDTKTAILKVHEADRSAHLRGDAADLISRVAPELISVANGKITRQTHEEALKFFRDYFRNVKYNVWEDVEVPVVQLSPDGKTAWAIYRVHAKYIEAKDGKQEPGEFVGAWMSAYELRGGQWKMTAVTSTFEPQEK